MASLLRNTQLIELCTTSISYDAQVQAGCSAFDYQMFSIIDDTGQVLFIPNIMGLTDSNLVDILAWQFHVDFYDSTRDLEFRKNLVQQSIIWHKRKGTVQLVQDVIDTYFPGAAWLQEWFNYANPLPPQFPTIDADEQATLFQPPDVDLVNNMIRVSAAVLADGVPVYFKLGTNGVLPAPLVAGTTYYVLNWQPTYFQVSATVGGSPVDLTTGGSGINEIWAKSSGTGTWHDRYRFRIYMNEQIVDPTIEQQVLNLINNFKPISRWPLDVVVPKGSYLDFYIDAVAKVWNNLVSLAAPLRTSL